jgi:uncharacterized protein YlzI (FlbEa/FlbD family)
LTISAVVDGVVFLFGTTLSSPLILSLPYKLRGHLAEYAVAYAADSINVVPNKKTTPSTTAEMVNGKKLEYKEEIRAPFGRVAMFKEPNQPSSSTDADPQLETGIILGRHRQSRSVIVYLLGTPKR